MKNNINIMPYIHLPIQSGDEKILKAMNREMKIDDYISKINKIRQALPTCSISTDLIVGFPNESETQFKNTLKLYNQVKFDNAYAFIYSPREGTPASLIKDKITLEIKQKRLAKLNEIVRK
jgi:tRNA-2-methylthio-N6-dimethylallyladenosine synthase